MLPAGNWGHSTPVRSPPASESASRSGLFKTRRSTLMSRHVGPRRGASTRDRGRPAIEGGQDALDPGASARNSPPTPTFEEPWRPGPASSDYSAMSRSKPFGTPACSISGPGTRSRSRDSDASLSRPGLRPPSNPASRPRRPLRLDRFKRRNPLAGNRFELLAQRLRIVGDELRAVARAGDGVYRPGFEALLEAVCKSRVGLVLSIEASRLARNGREWHALLDFCAIVGCLVGDRDRLYDPALIDGRMYLGF